MGARPYTELMAMAEQMRAKAIEIRLDLVQMQARDEARRQNDENLFGAKVDENGAGWQARERARPEVEATFAGIPARFEPYSRMPDPAAFNAPIENMQKVVGRLSTTQGAKDPLHGSPLESNDDLAGIETAADYLQDWDGDAAIAFKENFLDRFPIYTTGQLNVAAVLQGAIEAEKAVWQAARTDVARIAQEGIEALDRIGDCGKNEWAIGYTVLASVAAVGAVLAPVTGGLSLALTIVGGSAQVIAAAPPDDPPLIQFHGETPEAVIDEVFRGLTKLSESVHEQELKIANATFDNLVEVETHYHQLVAARPALASATPANVADVTELGEYGGNAER